MSNELRTLINEMEGIVNDNDDSENMADYERIISSPGKFEGEAPWVPYFYGEAMDGGAEEEREMHGTLVSLFTVEPEEANMFSELNQGDQVAVWEDDNGFAYGTIISQLDGMSQDTDMSISESMEDESMMDLSIFLDSDYYQTWREQNSSDMGFENPERAERMHQAAELGGDGSAYGEVIDDMRRAVESAYRDDEVTEAEHDALIRKIDEIEEYHIEQETIDDEAAV